VTPDIGEALAHLTHHRGAEVAALPPWHVHFQQSPDDRQETKPIEEEAAGHADQSYQKAGNRGAYHARAVEDHRIHRDRV
jgi:hypothetical protein